MPTYNGTTGADNYQGTVNVDDTAVVATSLRNATFSYANGRWSVQSSATGTDQLNSIEYVQFDDAIVSLTSAGLTQVNLLNRSSSVPAQTATLTNGSYVVAYNVATIVNGVPISDVYFQVFSASGERLGAQILANTFTSGDQGDPTIVALSGGGFALAWTSAGQDGSSGGVFLQRFDALGNKVGTEAQVNTFTAGIQEDAVLTALASGGFVVVWRSDGQDGGLGGVYAQRFDATGAKVGAETQVNTVTALAQWKHDVQALAGGGYVVAWRSEFTGGDSNVFLQRFGADGLKIGGEVAVDGGTRTIAEDNPAIAATADGGFLVAYKANLSGDVVSYSTIVVQRFDSAGNKVGDLVPVTAPPAPGQSVNVGELDILVLTNGGYVVTWANLASQAVSVQLFDANGNRNGTEYRLPSAGVEPTLSALPNGGFIVTWNDSAFVRTLQFRADGAPVLPTISGDYLPNRLNADGTNVFLSGGDGNDRLHGTSNQAGIGLGDWLEGGAGTDEMIGSFGDDTYIADNLDRIVELENQGNDTVRVSASYTLTADHVENLTLTGSQSAHLTGNSLANVITGNGADNFINGGLGADRMVGGNGNDTYFVEQAPNTLTGDPGDVVVEEFNGGTDTVVSEISYTLGNNVEILRLVGSDAIGGTGNALDNHITGNGGDNRLDGRAGNDTMAGEAGNDTYVVDALDRIFENEAGGYDTVEAAVSWTLGDNLERLILTGPGNLNATGNDQANVLIGNSQANILDGGGGADIMDGGEGTDTYIVDDAGDIASESNFPGQQDLVRASVTHTLGSNIELLTLTGTDSINGFGNVLNNTLRGNAADNILSGSSGIDTLYGNAGNDTLISTDGLDMLFGGSGDDYYNVTGTTDTITELTNQGNDTVVANVLRSYTLGLNLENLILQGLHVNGFGNTLANQITGTAGNNLLDGGGGADRLTGLGGNDTYVIDNVGDLVIEAFNGGTDNVMSFITHTLVSNVENLTLAGGAAIDGTGNSEDNRLVGNDAINTLNGGGGNDTLLGGGGNDRLFGGDGTDVLDGGSGNDRVDGGGGVDIVNYYFVAGNVAIDLRLTSAQNTLSAGMDTLVSIESVYGSNVGNDTITGDDFNNRIRGYGGNDILNGGLGDDVVSGNEGADFIIGDLGNDRLDGGNDRDTLSFANAAANISVDLSVLTRQNTGLGEDVILNFEVIEGSRIGNDRLFGDQEANDIFGLDGNDVLGGDDGADLLDGGLGSDTADYSRSFGRVIVNLSRGSAVDDGFGRIDTLVSIENLIGSELDDLLIGDANANVLRGIFGDDILEGGEGNDTLEGGDGDDRIDGQAGSDTASYGSASGGVVVNLALAINNTVSAGIDNLIGIENLLGSNFADLLTGNAGANRLEGGGGNDTLEGAAGNDFVDGGEGLDTASYANAAAAVAVSLAIVGAQNTGGAGTDTLLGIENLLGSQFNDTLTGDAFANVLTGGGGNDILDGAGGIDTAGYSNAGGGVTVNLGLTTAQNTVNAGSDTLVSIENIVGSNFADTLTGNTGNNILSGGLGNDIILSLGGNDVLNGGPGDDVLDGGSGSGDTATYEDASSRVAVDLALTIAQDTLGGGVDTLLNIESLTGSAYDDVLSGNSLANELTGGAGNDSLFGRLGMDRLIGGAGADRFYFDSALNGATNVDFIQDYNAAEDFIYLSTAVFDVSIGDLSGKAFHLGASAVDPLNRIIYNAVTGSVFYDADGSGSASPILFATFALGTRLESADFVGFSASNALVVSRTAPVDKVSSTAKTSDEPALLPGSADLSGASKVGDDPLVLPGSSDDLGIDARSVSDRSTSRDGDPSLTVMDDGGILGDPDGPFNFGLEDMDADVFVGTGELVDTPLVLPGESVVDRFGIGALSDLFTGGDCDLPLAVMDDGTIIGGSYGFGRTLNFEVQDPGDDGFLTVPGGSNPDTAEPPVLPAALDRDLFAHAVRADHLALITGEDGVFFSGTGPGDHRQDGWLF